MLETHRDLLPDDAWQRARHVLFVEGKQASTGDSFDHAVLSHFLQSVVQVEPLGLSLNLRSAAEALHPFHPTYYFIIDRDHQDESLVEATWRRFPDPAADNLLIWRRRELENYFIDPTYLLHSPHLTVDESTLRTCIREHCQKRLYLDAANQVITECRETLKKNWIKAFKLSDCPTRDTTLAALRDHPAFPEQRGNFSALTTPEALEARFVTVLTDWTGGRDPLEYGAGRWLERIQGNAVWNTVANQCFRITDARGVPLDGPRKQLELAKALVRLPLDQQPADFQTLRALVESHIRGASPSPSRPVL